jgi:hypothetical protein
LSTIRHVRSYLLLLVNFSGCGLKLLDGLL